MAATKKKAGTLPVVKHKLITVKQLGTRTRRELEDEVRELAAGGFKVYAFRRLPGGGVEIQMGKAEEWSVDDFMTEIDEMLGDCGC